MREITLYPGESITVGDTIIRVAHRGHFFGPTTIEPMQPGTPAHPQEIPSAPISPTPGCPWVSGTICDASGMAVDPLSR